jgi:hypothetical protein
MLLLAGMVLGGLARSALLRDLSVTAGFLGMVSCVRSALALWDLDAFVFEEFPKDLIEARRAAGSRERPSSRNPRPQGLRSRRTLPLERVGICRKP